MAYNLVVVSKPCSCDGRAVVCYSEVVVFSGGICKGRQSVLVIFVQQLGQTFVEEVNGVVGSCRRRTNSFLISSHKDLGSSFHTVQSGCVVTADTCADSLGSMAVGSASVSFHHAYRCEVSVDLRR